MGKGESVGCASLVTGASKTKRRLWCYIVAGGGTAAVVVIAENQVSVYLYISGWILTGIRMWEGSASHHSTASLIKGAT